LPPGLPVISAGSSGMTRGEFTPGNCRASLILSAQSAIPGVEAIPCFRRRISS